MVLAQNLTTFDVCFVVIYLALTAFLGWLGYRHTRSAADYLVAGRKAHPFIMAMSYGATFISTSAIVGFGGVAGRYGMSLLWLVFLNIFVGIFMAFIFLGGPTRRIGQALEAHTFPEFLGRRYLSKGIQVFAGSVIFLFIPIYAAAVLIGGCVFVETQFGVGYHQALWVFSVLVAAYVLAGGLKGVMYTDALQGVIMVVGMVLLLVFTYVSLGGLSEAHTTLASLADLASEKDRAAGNLGWMSMPEFGWGSPRYDQWWTVVTAITLGVGIGVLAQPQLVVRFMTVKSKRELNRAVVYGGLFILLIPGSAYVVGSLSNAWFSQHGPLIQGRVVQWIDPQRGHVMLQPIEKNAQSGLWQESAGKKLVPAVLDPKDSALRIVAEDDQGLKAGWTVASGRSLSMTYAAGKNDDIIPTFISHAMPSWFGTLFLLTLLSAAMSTLSSQFHTSGTALGRDVFEQVAPRQAGTGRTIFVVRGGILVGIAIAVIVAHFREGESVIARFTAIFFGLCSATFLPAYVGGLFFRRMTKAAAIASMVVGLVASLAWLVLVKLPESEKLGIAQSLSGKVSLLAGMPNWPMVDPVVIALPLSILTAVVVCLFTQPPAKDHLDRFFPPAK